MTKRYSIYTLALVGLLLGYSCNSDTTTETPSTSVSQDFFDREAMLTHWIDNFIIPYTKNFLSNAENLEQKILLFTQKPNANTLKEAQQALNQAYEAYQYIGFYRFGKAEEVTMNFQYRLNTYPTNIERIKQNALEKNYNFRTLSEISGGKIAQGLPAVDYLINGVGASSSEIINHYTTNPNTEAYKDYLNALCKEMKESSVEVIQDLEKNRNQFIRNTHSNASGSISLVVNAYIQYYEKNLRAGKIGYPAGILTPMYIQQSETPKPELVESLFSSQYNRTYALLGTKAMHDFFRGIGYNGKRGNSLQQYIEYMANKNKHHQRLSADINSIFNASISSIEALEDSFKTQIQKDLSKLKTAYGNLQNNIPKLKVDMAQALNITISYMDTDGD